MPDPSLVDLEARAVELYRCACLADLDYPGAWCPACDNDEDDTLDDTFDAAEPDILYPNWRP